MIALLVFLLVLSIIGNGILIWYTRKLIKNLKFGIENVDGFQKMLEEYCAGLEGVVQMEQYFADETITVAIKNTKLVIEACKAYKTSILETDESQDDNFEQ